MSSERISKESRINEGVFRLVSYTLVALMMTCAALTVASLLNRIEPTWEPWYIAGICFFVALDRLYTYRSLRDWIFLSQEWLVRFGTQWIVILVLAKLVVGLSHGLDAFLAEIPLWYRDFWGNFFSNEFLIVLILIIITWVASGDFADLLDELGLDEALLTEDGLNSMAKGKPPARVRLLSLFFSIGSVLVILTALARFDLRAIFLEHTPITGDQTLFVELPTLAGGGASTLLYFMLGMALLSQTQFMALNVRWGLQRIPVSRKLAGRWALYSILFLVFMAVVVSLLPTSYTLNPLAILGYFLNVLFYILLSVLQLIVALLLLVITPLLLLFGAEPPGDGTGGEPLKLPTPPADLNAAFGSPDWWELVKSIGFWAVFLAVLVFSAIQFLRQHEGALVRLRKLPGWRFLERAWHWMRSMFTSLKTGVSVAIEAGRKRLRARRAAAREMFENGFLNLRRLDARQRVTFFYLALVRRGAESGLTRKESQTPYEYAATLENALPAVDQDIDALTDAFIEARYSRREVAPEKANLVKTTWERIRKALRGRGK